MQNELNDSKMAVFRVKMNVIYNRKVGSLTALGGYLFSGTSEVVFV